MNLLWNNILGRAIENSCIFFSISIRLRIREYLNTYLQADFVVVVVIVEKIVSVFDFNLIMLPHFLANEILFFQTSPISTPPPLHCCLHDFPLSKRSLKFVLKE